VSAFEKEEGGDHYKDLEPQPAKVLHAWGVSHIEGEAIYHIIRWRKKDGLKDLRKAVHGLSLLIELEEARQAQTTEAVLHSGARFKA